MAQEEPSMEEILASIRRIISDDEEEAQNAAPKPDTKTEEQKPTPPPPPPVDKKKEPAAPPPPPVAAAKKPDMPPPPPSVKDEAEDADVLELTDVVEEAISGVAPPPPPPPAVMEKSAPKAPEPLPIQKTEEYIGKIIGPTAAEQSTRLFADFARTTAPKGFPMGEHNKTLEDMIKDLITPHLRSWLDANLPGLVERLVKSEIERMSRQAEDFTHRNRDF